MLWQPDGDPEALEIAINTIDRLVSEGGIHQLVEAAEAAVAANAIIPLLSLVQRARLPSPSVAAVRIANAARSVFARIMHAVDQELRTKFHSRLDRREAFVDMEDGTAHPIHPALRSEDSEALSIARRCLYALPRCIHPFAPAAGSAAETSLDSAPSEWPVEVLSLRVCALSGTRLAVIRVVDLEGSERAVHLILGMWEGPEGFRESEVVVGEDVGAHLSSWYAVTLAGAACVATHGQGRAVVFGLGGGGVTAFLARHCPHLQLEAVERLGEVVEAANTYFNLSDTWTRGKGRAGGPVETHVEDACAFVACPERAGQYHAIVVDVYTAGEYPPSLGTLSFFKDLRRALAPGGCAAINVGDQGAMVDRGGREPSSEDRRASDGPPSSPRAAPSSLQARFRAAFPETSHAFVEPPDDESEYPGGESTVLVGWKPAEGTSHEASAACQLAPGVAGSSGVAAALAVGEPVQSSSHNPMGELAWAEAARAIAATNAGSGGAPPLPFAVEAVRVVDGIVPPSADGHAMGLDEGGMRPVALRWGAPPESSRSSSSGSEGERRRTTLDEDDESDDDRMTMPMATMSMTRRAGKRGESD